MARSYDVGVAALAVGAPVKWVDNLLSRHRIAGVEQASQGTTRRLAPGAVLRIAVVRLLAESLGLPVARAVAFAEEVCGSPRHSTEVGGGTAALTVDIPRLERHLAKELADAVEGAPRRPRGRPPTRHPGNAS